MGFLDRFQKVDKGEERARVLRNRTNEALSNSRWEEAIECGEELVNIYRKNGNTSMQGWCYSCIGNAYYNLGNFRKAVECHEKSLKIDKEIGDKKGEVECCVNLGNAYCGLGAFRKAMEYQEKALADMGVAYMHCADPEELRRLYCIISAGYIGLGMAYHGLGDFKAEIEYYQKALSGYEQVGDRIGEAKCYMNLGSAYGCLGDNRNAIYCEQKALEILNGH